MIKRNNIRFTVAAINIINGERISQNEIDRIYSELYPCTQVKQEIKTKHIQDINIHLKESNEIQRELNDSKCELEMSCPKCGKELVLRVTKRGTNVGKEFYGCKGYPQCRYIRK